MRWEIFDADLPEVQYAYRPGRNAQQAVTEVGETLFRGHPEVVDADLAAWVEVNGETIEVPLTAIDEVVDVDESVFLVGHHEISVVI